MVKESSHGYTIYTKTVNENKRKMVLGQGVWAWEFMQVIQAL